MKNNLIDRAVRALFANIRLFSSHQNINQSHDPQRVASKSHSRRFLTGAALIAAFWSTPWAAPVVAADYNVGPGQTYATLEVLRSTSGIVWADGDTITLHGDDASLSTQFDFGDKSVTFKGFGNVTPGSVDYRAINTTGAVAVAAADGKTLRFTRFGNTASGFWGGVIEAGSADITLGAIGNTGTLFFDNNKAVSGGAIYGEIFGTTVELSGGTNSFLNNKATGQGGAIYVGENGTFIANDGDLTFQGNTAAGNPNAIYMRNDNGNRTLHLAAAAGKSVLLYDPVESNSTQQNLNIHINQTGADTTKPTQEYTGAVRFDKYQSKVYGNTTIHNGTMQLTNGAVYGAANNIGSFTLGAGATLLADAKTNGAQKNQISAGTITFDSGSTLAFDLTGADGVGQTTTNLVLDGTTVSVNPTAMNIDIDAFTGNGTSQTYNLVQATGITAANKTLDKTHGELISDTRAAGKLSLDVSGNVLQLTSTVGNGIVKWTGPDNGVWNATSENWAGQSGGSTDLTGETKFLHGDAVVFDHLAGTPRSVAIQATGVTIAKQGTNEGMQIASGDWTFTGGAITGGRIDFTGDGSVAFDTRTMNQRITVADGKAATVKALDGENAESRGRRHDAEHVAHLDRQRRFELGEFRRQKFAAQLDERPRRHGDRHAIHERRPYPFRVAVYGRQLHREHEPSRRYLYRRRYGRSRCQ